MLGSGEYALHEVQALLPVVKSVTLLTNGAALTADFPPEVSVCTQKVEPFWASRLSPACSWQTARCGQYPAYLWRWAWRAVPHWPGSWALP